MTNSETQPTLQSIETQLFNNAHPLVKRFMYGPFAWFSLSFVTLLFVLIPFSLAAVPFLLAWEGYKKVGYGVLLVWALNLLTPVKEWQAFRKVFELWFPIFNFRHNLYDLREEYENLQGPSSGKRYILALFPHGVVPIHAFLWCAYCDRVMRTKSGEKLYGRGAMASVLLWIPVLRQFMGWLSGGPADYKTLLESLKNDNIFVLPDGIAGIYYAAPGVDVAIVKKRRGLVKLALESGATLCPVYGFGCNYFFNQLCSPNSWLGKLSRKLRMSITLYWGRFGLPFLPYTPDVSFAFGSVIEIPKPEPNPSAERIEEVHQQFVRSLQEVFDKYKGPAGYPDANLMLV